MPDFIDETHQDIAEFLERHGEAFDDDERAGLLDRLMTHHGYTQESHWTRPEPDPQGGGQGGKPPVLKPKQRGGGQPPSGGQAGGQRAGYFRR
jgi:hypothetical protein